MENGSVVDLYIVWSQKPYKLTFHANLGSVNLTDLTPISFAIDNYINYQLLSFNDMFGVVNGATFKGWAIKEDGDEILSDGKLVDDLRNVGYGEINLYAKWELNTYTIKLDYQAGYVNGSTSSQMLLKYNDGYYMNNSSSKVTSVAIPTRDGYRFCGFYNTPINNNGGQIIVNEELSYCNYYGPKSNVESHESIINRGGKLVIDAKGNILTSNTELLENQTLYAYWAPIIRIVCFHTYDDKEYDRSVSKETNWTIPASRLPSSSEIYNGNNYRKGYKFNCWVNYIYGLPRYNEVVINENTVIKESMDLYAYYDVLNTSQLITIRPNTKKSITDSGRMNQWYDKINLNDYFDINELIAQDYTQMDVTITISIAEVDDGYQYVFIYNSTSTSNEDDYQFSIQLEHGPGKLDKTTYDHTMSTSLVTNKFTNGTFVIRYGASGNKDDDWINSNVRVNIEFK